MISPRLQHTEHINDTTELIKGDTGNVSATPSEVLSIPAVYLFCNGDGFTHINHLTPANARKLAAQLIAAASACDAQNEGKPQVA